MAFNFRTVRLAAVGAGVLLLAWLYFGPRHDVLYASNGTRAWSGYLVRTWNPIFTEVDQNFVRHGVWEFWWPNGNMKERGKYSFGWKEGRWTSWWPNGVKQSEGYYADGDNASEEGRRQGWWDDWKEDGKPDQHKSGNYHHGFKK